MAKASSSPIVRWKLIKSAKFFFEQDPIIVAQTFVDGHVCDKVGQHKMWPCDRCVPVDIRRLKSKIWITENLLLGYDWNPSTFLQLLEKIYCCQAKQVLMRYQHFVTIEQLLFLIKHVRNLTLVKAKIVDSDGTFLKLENIVECLPYLKDLTVFCANGIIDDSTMMNILRIEHINGLMHLKILQLPPILSLDHLANFLNKMPIATEICIEFDAAPMEDEYKFGFDDLVKSVFKDGGRNGYIWYYGVRY